MAVPASADPGNTTRTGEVPKSVGDHRQPFAKKFLASAVRRAVRGAEWIEENLPFPLRAIVAQRADYEASAGRASLLLQGLARIDLREVTTLELATRC